MSRGVGSGAPGNSMMERDGANYLSQQLKAN